MQGNFAGFFVNLCRARSGFKTGCKGYQPKTEIANSMDRVKLGWKKYKPAHKSFNLFKIKPKRLLP